MKKLLIVILLGILATMISVVQAGALMPVTTLAQTGQAAVQTAASVGGHMEERSAGRVVDGDGDGVAYAAVVVMDMDSVMIGSAACDSLGFFYINLPQGRAGADSVIDSVIVETYCYGYQKHTFTVQKSPDRSDYSGYFGLPSVITLEQRMVEGAIDEVVVTGKKTSFTRQGDRYVFRISEDLEIAKGSSVYDILKITPMVHADEQGTISVVGAGAPHVYINGRKSRMQNDALVAYLKSMPASDISNIEVLPIANSTYAGNGQFSVIDIHLKKRIDDGVGGMAQINTIQSHANSQYANISLNARKKKVGINAAVYAGHMDRLKYFEEQRMHFLESDNTADYQKYRYVSNVNGGLNLSLDYDIDDKQVLGIVLNGSYTDNKTSENTISKYGNKAYSTIDSMYNTSLENKGYDYNLSANINYQLKTDSKGSIFSVDIDYVHYNNISRQSTIFDRISLDGSQGYALPVLLQRLPQLTRAVTGKVAYSHVFGRWGNLDVGADFQSSTSQDDSYYATGEWENKNEALSNNFAYTEIIPALFASYSTQWTPKFSTTIGGRMEYTYTRSEQRTTGDDTKRYNMRFLPTAFLTYAFDQDNNLSYSISNRMDYPVYRLLNSFRSYTSPTSYETGDPYLRPERQLDQSLSYSYKGKLTASLGYLIRKDRGMIITTPTDDNVGTKTMSTNLDNEIQASLNIGMSGSYFNGIWWANNSISLIYLAVKGVFENELLESKVGVLALTLNNTFILSKKHNLSMNINYYFQAITRDRNMYSAPRGNLSMSLKKGFGDFYVSLGAWSLLDDADVIREVMVNNGISQHVDRKSNYPTFTVNLSYTFGSSSVRGSRNRSTSGESVRGRL